MSVLVVNHVRSSVLAPFRFKTFPHSSRSALPSFQPLCIQIKDLPSFQPLCIQILSASGGKAAARAGRPALSASGGKAAARADHQVLSASGDRPVISACGGKPPHARAFHSSARTAAKPPHATAANR
jgi:hypothetical protein